MGCNTSKGEDGLIHGPQPSHMRPGTGNIEGLSTLAYSSDHGAILTVYQRELIRTTWADMEENLATIGKQIFLCIFDQNHTVKNLFPFRDFWGDDLIRHPQFTAHTTRFMGVVQQAVGSMDNLEGGFAPVLISLGARHTKNVGFTADFFSLFKSSMMVVWARQLGNKMTPDVNRAWNILLDFIVSKLQQGYYGKAKMEELNGQSNESVLSLT